MARIPSRPPYSPVTRADSSPSARGLARQKPLRKVSIQRSIANRRYEKMREWYLLDNPRCEFGFCERPAIELHHLARGANRAASLSNPNTLMGVCREHHDAIQDMPIELQAAHKLAAVIRRLNEYRKRVVRLEDVKKHL